jgi:hypothetical protein
LASNVFNYGRAKDNWGLEYGKRFITEGKGEAGRHG